MAWALSAFVPLYIGDLEEAEHRLPRYKRLSPLDPHAFFYDGGFVVAALLKRDLDSAVVVGRDVTEMNPSFSAPLKPYLVALGHLGNAGEAADVLARLRSIEPGFSVQRFIASTPFARQEDTEIYVAGLRAAGVPEESLEEDE